MSAFALLWNRRYYLPSRTKTLCNICFQTILRPILARAFARTDFTTPPILAAPGEPFPVGFGARLYRWSLETSGMPFGCALFLERFGTSASPWTGIKVDRSGNRVEIERARPDAQVSAGRRKNFNGEALRGTSFTAAFA